MKKTASNNITSKQLTSILVVTVIGIKGFSLPNRLSYTSNQDAWISAAIGGVYPLLIAVLSIFFIKNFPNKNILSLSKDYLGTVIGSILNLIFALGFIIHLTSVTREISDLLLTSLANFLTTYKLIIVFLAVAGYAAYKDLKVLGRVSTATYLLAIILSILLIFGLKGGDKKNLLPFLGSGLPKVITAGIDSLSAYTGIEILFLIYPFVSNKDKIISSIFKAVLTIVFIYVLFVFTSLYSMGADLLPRYLWGLSTISKAIKIPVINNFRFIFLVLWSIITFNSISNSFYATKLILKATIPKLPKRWIYFFIFALSLYVTLQYKDVVMLRTFIKRVAPFVLIFNIGYISIILVMSYLKGVKRNEAKAD